MMDGSIGNIRIGDLAPSAVEQILEITTYAMNSQGGDCTGLMASIRSVHRVVCEELGEGQSR